MIGVHVITRVMLKIWYLHRRVEVGCGLLAMLLLDVLPGQRCVMFVIP